MNLTILIVHFIMLSEDISSWMASVGSDSPDKFANLNDSIRHQMMQLPPSLEAKSSSLADSSRMACSDGDPLRTVLMNTTPESFP
jgi:hypothetical protein